jgi:hypothetical protein
MVVWRLASKGCVSTRDEVVSRMDAMTTAMGMPTSSVPVRSWHHHYFALLWSGSAALWA